MDSSLEPLGPFERARWLAELAFAVEQAQQLASEIGASTEKRRAAQELHAQLEAIRIELEMLRRGRPTDDGREADPKWMNLFGWDGPRAA